MHIHTWKHTKSGTGSWQSLSHTPHCNNSLYRLYRILNKPDRTMTVTFSDPTLEYSSHIHTKIILHIITCIRTLYLSLLHMHTHITLIIQSIHTHIASTRTPTPQLHTHISEYIHTYIHTHIYMDFLYHTYRYPLHLAAAEARILVVSFLLGISANPNCKDRWGGTPLDDALRGGTPYHLYCAKVCGLHACRVYVL